RLVDLVSRIAGPRRQPNLIIALSKMDELRVRDGWAGIIGDMWPDSPPSPAELPAYFRQMDHLSEMLRIWWTDPDRQSQNLMNRLPPRARFCALSSGGHQPIWNCAQCGAVNPGTLRSCTPCLAPR